MPTNPWNFNIVFDSCAFNPHSPESQASNEILRFGIEKELRVLIPASVLEEVNHPNTPLFVKAKKEG